MPIALVCARGRVHATSADRASLARGANKSHADFAVPQSIAVEAKTPRTSIQVSDDTRD